MPQLGATGEDERRQGSLCACAEQVGGEHEPLALEPVGPDAADEQKRHERHASCGQDEPERRGRRVHVEYRERKRDGHQPVSEL